MTLVVELERRFLEDSFEDLSSSTTFSGSKKKEKRVFL